jgi:hypothetical protein
MLFVKDCHVVWPMSQAARVAGALCWHIHIPSLEAPVAAAQLRPPTWLSPQFANLGI